MAEQRQKKPKKAPEGAPAWMVTYSDLVTLLLTFFVLLISMANMDPVKFLKVANSMRSAFGVVGQVDSLDIAPQIIDLAADIENDMAQRVYKRVQLQLNKLKLNKDISLVVDRGAVVLRVNNMLLFDAGKSQVKPEAYPMLRSIANLIQPLPLNMRAEGHTDSSGSEETNWDISIERAVSVIKFFSREDLLPLERISAVGFGSQQPLAPNDSPGNMALNRRVEFVLESVGSYTDELPYLIDAQEQFPF